jgi:hypothetical protein
MSSIAAVSGPTPKRLSRPGGARGDQRHDQLVEPAQLVIEELGAAAGLAQRQQGVIADHAARAGPERGQLGDQAARRLPGEPGADVVWPGDDQRPGLVDGLGPLPRPAVPQSSRYPAARFARVRARLLRPTSSYAANRR